MYPAYVHSVFPTPSHQWPVIGQRKNECSFTAMTNALNCLSKDYVYQVDDFIREVGPLFQAQWGGTLPPLKAWQLRRRGYGSHYGNLRFTDCEHVLRQLIDLHIPIIIDIYTGMQVGMRRIYGQHAVVLVGYSDPYRDANGVERVEYYLIDSEWPHLGAFDISANDVDRDGDGIAEEYPGNRTLARHDFLRIYTTRCYAPIFHTPAAHETWYHATFQTHRRSLWERAVSGSNDRLLATITQRMDEHPQ